MAETMVELRQVTRRYPGMGGAQQPPPVLDGIDWRLEAGSAVAIVGPSGCGKSTLLNIVGTLDRPDDGTVLIGGEAVGGLSEAELARLRCRELGFVFQEHHLLPQCTVLENVLVPTLAPWAPEKGGAAASRARQLLGEVGLGDRIDHRPAQLSGGERQRVAVVRALINRPRLLLADEPTGALDRANARQLTELLLRLHAEQGTTLIMVTHAAELANLLPVRLTLREGRLEDADA